MADIGQGLAQLIQRERGGNPAFTAAFAGFLEKCRQSINPNLSEAAVEEMLIQHLLTERHVPAPSSTIRPSPAATSSRFEIEEA